MLKVVGCFVEAHDHGLVALAALICCLAAVTTIGLLSHARKSRGVNRMVWLLVAGVAGGSGTWATHFIAMLAFSPGLPSAYAIGPTILSLVLAVVITSVGFAVALTRTRRSWIVNLLGGAIVGFGIAGMHYTGMAAYQVAGRLAWDGQLVVVSVGLAVLLGALSMMVSLQRRTLRGQAAGAGLLALAIVGHHFTGMGAVEIVPDPTIFPPDTAFAMNWVVGAVAAASLAILLLAITALCFDMRDRRHAALERERLQSLANAAVEGLVVCRGTTIVSANRSFMRMIGAAAGSSVVGRSLDDFVHAGFDPSATLPDAEILHATELTQSEGGKIPVEIIVQALDHGSRAQYAVAVRDLRARRLAELEIQFLARHDSLTGLPNRASFGLRLDQEVRAAEQRGDKLAVMYLDLDRFKEINDVLGHPAGDAVLQRVALMTAEVAGDKQMTGRLGGDEFAVLVPCRTRDTAGALARKLLEALRPPDGTGGRGISVSIGIAMYPDDGIDPATLLGHADLALYRAKADGRTAFRFFEASMGTELRERRSLEQDLEGAIERGEMALVYQPQVSAGSGEVAGFEALLRWRHPARGPISPDSFIPIAEESGLILSIGEWVLKEACREAATWDRPLRVAVNVSAVQLHATSFVQLVHETLLLTGLQAARLELEITETALIRDPVRALQTLRQLKALGVTIAMDDFGTGYSSLSNLRSYPFDRIKIDRSFISSVHSIEPAAAIVRAVLVLGRGLGLPVLAEGVETDEELDFLHAAGCEEVQGFLVGRPAGIASFAERLAGRPALPPPITEAA